MGIKSASKIISSCKNLTVKDIKDALNAVIQQQHNVDENEPSAPSLSETVPNQQLVIDVDCNWVACYLGGTKTPTNAPSATADFLEVLSNYGFIVNPICDGQSRHFTKRASIDRVANREKCKIDAFESRYSLLNIIQQINNEVDAAKKEELQKKRDDLIKRIKSLENKCKNIGLSPTFASDLMNELEVRGSHNVNDNHGIVECVKIGLFQADSVIAKRAVQSKSHLIISSDTDFFTMIGQKCILVRGFKLERGKGGHRNNIDMMKLVNLELGVCSKTMMEVVVGSFNREENKNIAIKKAEYPVLDFADPLLRSTIAVILGSDVFIGGIPKIGIAKLFNQVKLLYNEGHSGDNVTSELRKWACEKDKNVMLDAQSLEVFVQALIYEPANEVTLEGNIIFESQDQYSYIHPCFKPNDIQSPYLQDFIYCDLEQEKEEIDLHADLCYCLGPTTTRSSTNRHVVFKNEVKKCKECNERVCQSCNKSGFCLPCYCSQMMEVRDAGVDCDNPRQIQHDFMTINEMMSAIQNKGYDLDASATPDVIEELYDSLIVGKQLEYINDSDLDKVVYPILPSDTVDRIQKASDRDASDEDIDIICNIPFSEGGRFIADPKEIPDEILPKVLELFATLVEYTGVKYTKFDHTIYSVLPSYFVEIAYGSRTASGHRLLRRTTRHAMDSKAHPLTEKDAILFKSNDTIGISLSNLIPASMKDVEYDTSAVITANDLLACKCNCMCGAVGTERIVCIHVLPVIFGLSLLLVDGLAENILLEVCARFNNLNEADMSNDMITKMKKSLGILMLASGDSNLQNPNTKSICNMLSDFQVGTERRKSAITGLPDPSMIGAIIDLPNERLVSSEQMAAGRMKRSNNQNSRSISFDQNKVVYKRFVFNEEKINNCFTSIPCQTCNDGHLTSWRCEICGKAFCVICVEGWGSGSNRIRCGPHANVMIENNNYCIDVDSEESTSSSNPTFTPVTHVELEERGSNSDEEAATSSSNPTFTPVTHVESEERGSSSDEETSTFTPDYLKISMILEVLYSRSKSDKNPIGYDLLRHRAENQKASLSFLDLSEQYKRVEEEMHILFDATHFRNKKNPGPTKKPLSNITNTIATRKRPISECNVSTQPNKKLKRIKKYCCFNGCKSNEQTHPLFKIPKIPNPLPKDASCVKINAHQKQKKKRESFLSICGLKKNDKRKDLRYCSLHFSNDKVTREARDMNTTVIATNTTPSTNGEVQQFRTCVQSKKGIKQRCCFVGCKSNDQTHSLRKIITRPNPLPDGASSSRKETYQIKTITRELFLSRCGLDKHDERINLRYCSLHFSHEKVQCKTIDGVNFTATNVPSANGVGVGSHFVPSQRQSNGNGRDRFIINQLQQIDTNNDPETAEWIKLSQSLAEELDSPINRESINMNPVVASLVNIDMPKLNTKSKQNHAAYTRDCNKKRRPCRPYRKYWKESPREVLLKHSGVSEKSYNARIKRKTGFDSENDMLAFIFVVCNGDIQKIMETTHLSVLTWYEEWCIYFEKMWGRTNRRWIDMACPIDGFGIAKETIIRIFDSKAMMVNTCLNSWPAYASLDEDIMFGNKEMQKRYAGSRIIFWDMTSIKIPKPNDAQMQRLTYSPYYGCNCFKGGSFIQLCGWLGTHDLWTGCVSDTRYQNESGILEKQMEFATTDLDENGEVTPFTNILDKGYRIRLAAFKVGKQMVLQPIFAKSDATFGRTNTLTSAGVAADRACNERGVRLCKTAGYLHEGLKNHQSMKRMHFAWLNWGFQANFMFNPVL